MPETFPAGGITHSRDYALSGYYGMPDGHECIMTPFLNSMTPVGKKLQTGWNYICIPSSYYTSLNHQSTWSEKTVLEFEAASTSEIEIKIAAIQVLDTSYQSTCILFDFDNALQTVYTNAYPILSAAGFKATSGVISNKVGSSMVHSDVSYPLMTETQLNELYEDGWDLENHTRDHNTLSGITFAKCHSYISDCQNYLEENGFYRASRHLVFPSGRFDQVTFDVMESLGVLSGRTHTPVTVRYDGDYITPMNSLGTVSINRFTTGFTVDEICGFIDDAIIGGYSLALCGHSVCDGEAVTDYDTPVADFQAIVDHVVSKGNAVKVCTKSEYYNKFSNPRYQSFPLGRT
jgi:peptidoglycan/xylan/chitin deacetylase (PgdA/CDA1 family)